MNHEQQWTRCCRICQVHFCRFEKKSWRLPFFPLTRIPIVVSNVFQLIKTAGVSSRSCTCPLVVFGLSSAQKSERSGATTFPSVPCHTTTGPPHHCDPQVPLQHSRSRVATLGPGSLMLALLCPNAGVKLYTEASLFHLGKVRRAGGPTDSDLGG